MRIKKEDVEKVVGMMNKFSTGYDGIPMNTIKKNKELFGKILPLLFDLSLNQGKSPECLKIAMIMPIPNGDASKIKNYGSISLITYQQSQRYSKGALELQKMTNK